MARRTILKGAMLRRLKRSRLDELLDQQSVTEETERESIGWDEIDDIPTEFPPAPHTHPWDEITDKPTEFPPAPHTHVEVDITDLDKYTQAEVDAKDAAIQADLDAHKAADNPHGITPENIGAAPEIHTHVEADITDLDRVRARGLWAPGAYLRNDMVQDSGWMSVANKDTTDQPSPQRDGGEFYLYSGASPTVNSTSKLLLFANRYTFTQTGYLNGYRLYLIAGNSYDVYSVKNPDTENIVTSMLTISPSTTGWHDFGINSVIVLAGTVLDIVVIVREPDASPTTFSGDWFYNTPNNAAVPSPGSVSHANKALASLRIHKEDNDALDRSAELEALTVGDVINGAGKSWAIQSISDNGTWMDFGVAPAEQGGPDGVDEFVFETVTATPITYQEDPGYWASNANIQGILSLNGNYDSKVINENAYGVDLLVQYMTISDDWDLYSYSSQFDVNATAGAKTIQTFHQGGPEWKHTHT